MEQLNLAPPHLDSKPGEQRCPHYLQVSVGQGPLGICGQTSSLPLRLWSRYSSAPSPLLIPIRSLAAPHSSAACWQVADQEPVFLTQVPSL